MGLQACLGGRYPGWQLAWWCGPGATKAVETFLLAGLGQWLWLCGFVGNIKGVLLFSTARQCALSNGRL